MQANDYAVDQTTAQLQAVHANFGVPAHAASVVLHPGGEIPPGSFFLNSFAMRSLAKSVLTDSHLKAIGLVAAEWSWTELCLENLIWEMAEIGDAKGHAITTHISSETRINILSTLAYFNLTNAGLKKDLAVIVDRIRRLRTERNNIMHSLWLPSKPKKSLGLIASAMKKRRKPTPAAQKITAKGKIVVTNKMLTAKQILSVANEIAQLVADMYDLLDRIESHRKAGRAGPAVI